MCLLFSREDVQSFILVSVMDVEKFVDSVQEKMALWKLRTKLYNMQKISENVNRNRTGLGVSVFTYNKIPLTSVLYNFSSHTVLCWLYEQQLQTIIFNKKLTCCQPSPLLDSTSDVDDIGCSISTVKMSKFASNATAH